jgi:hypothetical protein
VSINNGFFHNVRSEIQRYTAYLRERITEIMERMSTKMRQLGSKISDRFNFSG